MFADGRAPTVTAMNTHFNEWPSDFAAFTAARHRQFDAMNADSVLREVAERPAPTPEPPMSNPATIVLEGELTVLVAERRLVLGYFAPGQSDLADVVAATLGFRDEAFGIGTVGPVRITVEALQPEPAPKPKER
jgi:hypothetical protein